MLACIMMHAEQQYKEHMLAWIMMSNSMLAWIMMSSSMLAWIMMSNNMLAWIMMSSNIGSSILACTMMESQQTCSHPVMQSASYQAWMWLTDNTSAPPQCCDDVICALSHAHAGPSGTWQRWMFCALHDWCACLCLHGGKSLAAAEECCGCPGVHS